MSGAYPLGGLTQNKCDLTALGIKLINKKIYESFGRNQEPATTLDFLLILSALLESL